MTDIAVQCPVCRTTDAVPPSALLVDADAETGDEGSAAPVAWLCSGCDDLVSAPVAWAALLAMVSAGAVLLETVDGDETTGAGPA